MAESICICIPVRLNSTRVPDKALIKLNGKTVIRRTIEQALKSKYVGFHNLFVMTDSVEIAEEVEKIGVSVIMTEAPCQNALVRISKYSHKIPKKFKAIINLHGDEPYLNSDVLDFLIEEYLKLTIDKDNNDDNDGVFEKESCDGIMLCQKISWQRAIDPSIVKTVCDANHNLMYCSRALIPNSKSGGLDKMNINFVSYYSIVGTHILSREVIQQYDRDRRSKLYLQEDVEELKILEMGFKIKCLEIPVTTERSLNTPADLKYLQEQVAPRFD